jgi:hypothetical protein
MNLEDGEISEEGNMDLKTDDEDEDDGEGSHRTTHSDSGSSYRPPSESDGCSD